MIKTKNTRYSPKCNQCQSDLILVTEVSELLDDYPTPVTTITYRCSDATCQKDIDKKTTARIKFQLEHEDAKQKRFKKNAEFRKSRVILN